MRSPTLDVSTFMSFTKTSRLAREIVIIFTLLCGSSWHGLFWDVCWCLFDVRVICVSVFLQSICFRVWRHHILEKIRYLLFYVTEKLDWTQTCQWVECCLGLMAGGVCGESAYRSEVMHRKPLLGVSERVRPYSNGEEKLTCRDLLMYSGARKKRVRVNEGGVVVVQGALAVLWWRTDRSEFIQAYLTPMHTFSLAVYLSWC